MKISDIKLLHCGRPLSKFPGLDASMLEIGFESLTWRSIRRNKLSFTSMSVIVGGGAWFWR